MLAVERATGRGRFDSADASIGHAAVRGAIIGYFVVARILGERPALDVHVSGPQLP
jgi:hypothetical protein